MTKISVEEQLKMLWDEIVKIHERIRRLEKGGE